MLLLLSSCEGLLEKNPISDIPTTDMWKSQDDATAWIAGTYDGLQTTFQSNFWIWGEIRADNFRSTGTSTTSARILGKSTESGDQATMFITHAPCIECAKGIYQSGIKEVFYETDYKSADGVEFLKKCNVKVEKI